MLHAYTSTSSSSTVHLNSAISSSTTLSDPQHGSILAPYKAALASRSELSLAQPRPAQVISTKMSSKKLAQGNENMAKLHELFGQGLPVKDVEGVLEEFAWRSLLRGVCVREWCSELKYILDQVGYFAPRQTCS